jgi:hypothetical protein
MRTRLVLAMVAAALPLIGSAQQAGAPVAIYIDEPSSSLVARDCTVLVDGTPVPATAVRRGPQPLSVIALTDASDSVGERPVLNAGWLRGAVRPADTLRLGTFGDRLLIGTTAIVDEASAARAEREVAQDGGASPLWDAISASVDALRESEGVRAVLVFSDGLPTGNDKSYAEVYDTVVSSGVTVSVVGIADSGLWFVGEVLVVGRNNNLRKLAQDSGGEYTELLMTQNGPSEAMLGFLRRLRGRARLEFVPPVRDGAVHRVSVEVDGRLIGKPVSMRF